MYAMVRTLLRKMRCESRIRQGFKLKTRLLILTAFAVMVLCLYRFVGHRISSNTVHRKLVTSYGQSGNAFQACVHPDLPVWGKEGHAYIENTEQIVCNNEKDWVYTENGKFYISAEAVSKHRGIKCAVAPIINVDDNFVIWKPVNNIKNGTDLISDGFAVRCVGGDKEQYKNVHACISRPQSGGKYTNNTTGRFNVFIYGFDSMSANMFKRLLPKTHAYFTETLGGKLLGGYNIVGDGTTQALLPMLTGYIETELPEVRRGKPDAKPIDELATFIWKRYANKGYVTQWGEDMAHIGTFQYRLLGFKEQPVHHYMRAFQLFAPNLYNDNRARCLGYRPRHIVFQDWFKEGLNTNQGKNFFTFSFFSEYSHENNNPVRLTDDDNVEFFKFLGDKGILDNTILILMSDHGIRYGHIRETEQGKFEERMPYFGFRFPNKFKNAYPDKMKAFETNTKRLSTPFDVHETLVEILSEDDAEWRRHIGNFKGQSLFREIPSSRTCHVAGIDPHWCACMQETEIAVSDINVQRGAEAVVDFINKLLEPFSSLCHTLTLASVSKGTVLKNNENVLKFKGTLDQDGRVADLSDTLLSEETLYQIAFSTLPSNAVYEATVRKIIRNDTFVANEKHISRLNRYGDAPNCIAKEHPALRPYCVC